MGAPLSLPMFAIPDEGVDVSLGDAEGMRIADWDRRSRRWVSAWGLPAGFSSQTRVAQAQVPLQTSGRWRGGSRGSPVGCVA